MLREYTFPMITRRKGTSSFRSNYLKNHDQDLLMWNFKNRGHVELLLLLFTLSQFTSLAIQSNKGHNINKMMRQTFSKRDHDQGSVHKDSVSQMLRNPNRLWLLELHKTHARCHRHRRITVEMVRSNISISWNWRKKNSQVTI